MIYQPKQGVTGPAGQAGLMRFLSVMLSARKERRMGAYWGNLVVWVSWVDACGRRGAMRLCEPGPQ